MADWLHWTLVVVGSLPLIALVAWGAFDDWEGFKESVWYWIKPDIVSWIDGSGWEDMAAEWRLFVFLILSVAIVVGMHFLLLRIF